MSESDRVKSKEIVNTSDSEVSDSEFQNVAKRPKLDSSAQKSPRKSSSSSSSSSSGSGDEWDGKEGEGDKKK